MSIYRLFSLILLLTAFVAPVCLEAIPTRRLGLMIGANDGGKERVKLKFATTDARTFSHSMEELGGLDPQDRILLENPDSLGISQALDQLAAKARQAKMANGRVEAVIFYSGHADEQGLMLKGKHFGFPEFRAKVDKVPADVRIAIVDACASGTLTRLKGGRALPAFLSDESSQSTGYAFLTSSSADEAAQESDRIGASFFSHYMNTGLRGAADASQDGRVTLHEAYQYAYKETLARTEKTAGGPQHAGYDMRIAGTGDVVMTELSRAEASLALPDSISGRFFIRDTQDRLVAEIQKPAGRPLRIALQAGAYQAFWHNAKDIRTLSFTLPRGTVFELFSTLPWKAVSKELAIARGLSSNSDSIEEADTWARKLEPQTQFELFHNRATEDYRGSQMTLAYNHALRRFDGQQLAVLVNRADSRVNGIQAAGAFNYTRGQMEGGQVSGAFNIGMMDLQGLEITSGFNFLKGELHGFQGSGLFNYAKAMPAGFQASSGFNLVQNGGRGLQASTFSNSIGDTLQGGQGALIFNFVRRGLKGAQISFFLNVVSDTVEGYQIGFLNIAKSYRSGSPIGILNFIGDGIWRGETWIDETGFVHIGLLSGSRYVNTRIALGSKTNTNQNLGSLSIGAEGHLPLKAAFMELGLMTTWIGEGSSSESVEDMPNFLQRLRLTAGIDLGRHISLAGGVSYALVVTPKGQRPWTDQNWLQRSGFNDRIFMWPGVHLSLRVGTPY